MFKNRLEIAVLSLGVFVVGIALSYIYFDSLYQNALKVEQQVFAVEAKQVQDVLAYETANQIEKIQQLQSTLESKLSLLLFQSKFPYFLSLNPLDKQANRDTVTPENSDAKPLMPYFDDVQFNAMVPQYFKSNPYILEVKWLTKNQQWLPHAVETVMAKAASSKKSLPATKIFLSEPYEASVGNQTRRVASFLAPIYLSEVLAGYLIVTFDNLALIDFVKATYHLNPRGGYELTSEDRDAQYFKSQSLALNRASEHVESLALPLEIAQKPLVLKVVFDLESFRPEGEFERLVSQQWPIKIGILTALFIAIWVYLLFSINFKEGALNRKLAEEKAVYEKLFKDSVEGYLLLSMERVKDCNQVSMDAFNYRYKYRLIGQSWANLSPKFQPDGQSSNVKINTYIQFCFSNERARFEWQFLNHDKKTFWADVILTLVELDGEKLVHVSWRDISKQKSLQKKYLLAKEKAEASSAAKTAFIGNISHELRTPIHGILSYAQIGISRANSAPPEKIERYFTHIHDSGHRLSKLLTDLLDLVKFGAGKMRLVPEQTDINALLLSCLEMQSAGFLKKNLTVEWRSEGVVNFMAEVDPARIEQVVINLLNNAIKFSDEQGGQIQIHLDNQSYEQRHENGESETIEMLVFSISDEGQGIPPGEEEKIFNQFEQSSKQEAGTAGTGLGLSICKEIVKLHSGKIWASNNPGKGACFSVMLPVVFQPQRTFSELDKQE